MNIEPEKSTEELAVKRFYLPAKISDKCPQCKDDTEFDNYISYPVLGEPERIDFYCERCDYEWDRQIVIDVSVREVAK